MDRKEFLKTCGMACIGGMSLAVIMQSCAASGQYFAHNELSGDHLKVPVTEFTQDKKGQAINRQYVIVKSESLNFPIYLRKVNETEYSAAWMQCTHQGAELAVHGDYLSCPAHGSEFNQLGKVTQGPAQYDLRTFKTTVDGPFINIYLS